MIAAAAPRNAMPAPVSARPSACGSRRNAPLISCMTNSAATITPASAAVSSISDLNQSPVRSTVVVVEIADHIHSHNVFAASANDLAMTSKPASAAFPATPPTASQMNESGPHPIAGSSDVRAGGLEELHDHVGATDQQRGGGRDKYSGPPAAAHVRIGRMRAECPRDCGDRDACDRGDQPE